MEADKYKYTEESERYKRMNKFYVVATSLLGVVFLFYLWMKLLNHNIASMTVYGNTFLIVLFIIVNTIVHRKNTATKWLKIMTTWEVGIEYFLVGVQTDASFIHYALICIFILQIPYYEKKSLKRTAAGMLILYIAVMCVQASKGIYGSDVNALCGTLMVIIIGVVILNIGKISIIFNSDAVNSAKEEHDKVRKILDNMIVISKTVGEETDASTSIMNDLVDATKTVTGHMKEITDATNMTATSIETQNTMTASIQQAIEHAGEVSNRMVGIAIDSNESI